ncbi:MAG: hypothetical protein IIA41_03135 [SAR324 cluster bacterium]|nr:hypothetical protein [SAR324 cluster bacterium]
MKAMFGFMGTMLLMPKPWLAWVGLLMAVNMVAPLFFLATPEAQLTLLAFALGALSQMAIYGKLGWVRLLGVGHLPWVPLVIWLLFRLSSGEAAGAFALWLWALIVLNGISLVIDTVEVVRFLRGDRAPTLGTLPQS